MGWQDDADGVDAPAPAGHWTEVADPVGQTQTSSASAPKAATETLDGLKAFARGAGQGATLGFGDEINGLIQALGDKARSGQQPPLAELYRRNRDMFRRENDAAQDVHPLAYLGGNLFGGVATAPLLAGSSEALAPGVLGSISRIVGGAGKSGLGAMTRVGASLGAAQGLGNSDAPIASNQALGDVLRGLAFGAAVPSALKGVGVAGGKAMGALGEAMDSGALATGRRVLTGGAHLIDANKRALTDDVVRQALDEGAIRAGGTTGGTSQRLKDLIGDASERLGTATKALSKWGVTGPDVDELADRYTQKADQLEKVYKKGGAKVYRDFADFLRQSKPTTEAPGNVTISAEDAKSMSSKELAEMLGFKDSANAEPNTLPLDKAVEIKRSLQEDTDYDKLISKSANKAKKSLAADFRKSLLDTVREQSSAHPDAASDFESQNERLSGLLEASKAAVKGANQASKRNAISLRDIAVAMSLFSGTAAAGHAGEGAGLAAVGIPASMVLRKFGPSTLASLLYRGQAIPRGINSLAGMVSGNPVASQYAARYLPSAIVRSQPSFGVPQLSLAGE